MAIELKVPALGESITEAVVAKWLKAVGESARVDEPVVELETDKVTVSLPAPASGTIAEQRAKVGTTVKVGAVVGTMNEGAVAAAAPEKKQPATGDRRPETGDRGGDGKQATGDRPQATGNGEPAPAKAKAQAPVPKPEAPAPAQTRSQTRTEEVATPSVERLSPAERWTLREKGPAALSALAPDAVLDGAHPREEVVPMSPLRRRIAERLVQAQHTAAILTTFNECDMHAVMELRAKHQEAFVAKHGIKLGFMSFFTKAVVESLKEWPTVNAELRGNEIVYKKHYDIGVAVGSGKGLVVPVVRDADRLGFAELEKKIAELGVRARDNKLTLPELQGGTFTISNGGIYGSMLSTPLLNMPQTGILGMHNIIKRPIAVGDEVKIRPMMYLALSYDHRMVDGREAVSFLVAVKNRIESPERLMFGL